MSVVRNRTGTPVQPPITTAGTPGTSDEVRTFKTYGGPCIVTNVDTAEDLCILVNENGATATNYLVKISAKQAVDVSLGGRVNVRSVSLFYADSGVAYTKAQVRGWER